MSFRIFYWIRISFWVRKNLHRKKIGSSEFSLNITDRILLHSKQLEAVVPNNTDDHGRCFVSKRSHSDGLMSDLRRYLTSRSELVQNFLFLSSSDPVLDFPIFPVLIRSYHTEGFWSVDPCLHRTLKPYLRHKKKPNFRILRIFRISVDWLSIVISIYCNSSN